MELFLLGWLGRAWLALPFLFDALFPSVFRLQSYEPSAVKCFQQTGQVTCTLKEISVVPRGIPFRFNISTHKNDWTVITSASLVGIGPDLTTQPNVHDMRQMIEEELVTLCDHINSNRASKRILVTAIVSTIFERLTPVAEASKLVPLQFSLSLSHTHTHTHSLSLSLSLSRQTCARTKHTFLRLRARTHKHTHMLRRWCWIQLAIRYCLSY